MAWTAIVRITVMSSAGTLIIRPTIAQAQGPTKIDLGGQLDVGGEAERYLRILMLAGMAPPQPFAIRPLYPANGETFKAHADHPWRDHWTVDSTPNIWSVRMLRPGARLVYNSSFPVNNHDAGPTWTGRGVTSELTAGIAAQLWRIQLQLAPVAFITQNQHFSLAPNGETGNTIWADARFPRNIDVPQRFGDQSYGRVDPGNSTLAINLPGAVVGASTAAQSWGPAREYPLILSNNSGGFPHVFVATRSPLNAGLFSIHARIIAGTLAQSAYSPIDTGPQERRATAFIVSIIPRGVPGLELGATRFIEAASSSGWPTLNNVKRLLSSGVTPTGSANIATENQLGSVFFRWAFPGAGFEAYGEYARDDYTPDVRRLLQYPDDLRAYVFGLQRVLHSNAQHINVFKFELVNGELSSSNRGERGDLAERKLHTPLPLYLHSAVRQGHTNHGLLLGAPEAFGGAGWRVGVDQFKTNGRVSFNLERSLRLDWLPTLTPDTSNVYSGVHPDVLWSAGAEVMRFAGKREYSAGVTAMLNLNRNLEARHDVFNLRTTFSVRGFR